MFVTNKRDFMLSIVLNTILTDDSHMRHFSHSFIKIKTITNDEEVGDNKTTVVALIAAAQRSIFLTQNT